MTGFKLYVLTLILSILGIYRGYSQDTQLPKPFINYTDNGLIYNTVFEYKEYSFSGLMVIKKQGDDYRIMLLSKLGPTIMDFSLTQTGLIWHKVPKGMESAVIKNVMEHDFSLILLKDLENPKRIRKTKKGYKVKANHKIRVKTDNIDRIIEVRTQQTLALLKTKAVFFYTDDDELPDEICVSHRYVKMRMEMQLLKN